MTQVLIVLAQPPGTPCSCSSTREDMRAMRGWGREGPEPDVLLPLPRDIVFIGLLSICALIILVLAAAAWITVYRLRHGEMPWAPLARRWLPEPVVHELPGPERPAVGQAMPRELHQHPH